MPKVLVIVPTYDERENIESLIAEILNVWPTCQVLVVDDNSPDGTGEMADQLAASDSRVQVLHRPGKLGLGTAYLEGFRYALDRRFDLAITMDADFSHHPRYLPDLIQGCQQYDLTIGSRYIAGGGVRNWGIHRRILSRTANFLARLMLGLRANDCTAGFRCYRRPVLQRLSRKKITSHGYSCLLELLYRCQLWGFRIGEVPIIFVDRQAGTTKISKKEIWGAIKTLVCLRLARS